MSNNKIHEQDFMIILKWLEDHTFNCNQCKGKEFDISNKFYFLPIASVDQSSIHINKGKIIIYFSCNNCANAIFLDAFKVIPNLKFITEKRFLDKS